jgi:hypothetical protein
MKSKAPMILCGVVGLLPLVLLIGATAGSRTPTQWEYGIYTDSAGNYDWQDANRRVQATNPTNFFEQMGFPTGIEVDVRTGRVPAMVLNHLGRQGWELVDMRTGDAKRNVYWFKRPK